MRFFTIAILSICGPAVVSSLLAQTGVSGYVYDPQGKVVAGAELRLFSRESSSAAKTTSDSQGRYEFPAAPGAYSLGATAPGFTPVTRKIDIAAGTVSQFDLRFEKLSEQNSSIVITGKALEPATDLRNAEVFNRTLFSRDDQVFQQLDAGIDAGQHEGGGKSLEIRRFGFNLDHGGVNGGLKVLVDDVQQNQATQGHGQGYLGSLKALSPELIETVTVINGPFSAEYGDFSGLGVVQIHQRETLPDEFTARLQGGNFNARRAFLAYSPISSRADSYLSYESSYTDGPFQSPLRYRRDNVNGNYTRTLPDDARLGFRILLGRNRFDSSGQIPLDLVSENLLNRFGYIDPTDGGRISQGTLSGYYSTGGGFRADAFVSRSLFDLFSDFTFFLNDPVHGDGIQQHDSRLQEGANSQYIHSHRLGAADGVLTVGTNLLDNGIIVGLYPREGRIPVGVTTRAHARVTNGAAYIQENISLWSGRLLLGGGLRYDAFRFDVHDLVTLTQSGTQWAGRWQGKGSLAFTPARSLPLSIYLNYGRGINSADARAVVQRPGQPRLATTDFYQAGASLNARRFAASVDLFLIDHSNEQVYIPDDGSFEFKGPSRAYGYEAKVSFSLTRHLSLNAGLTKIANAFYRGGPERAYVDSAPHFVGNAALTLAAWHGWSGSLSMRAINHYLLDGENPGIVASGHTVWDAGVSKTLRKGLDLNLSVDNLTNRDYYETQNYFDSRVAPDAPVVSRIHGTPGYPITLTAGLTFRFGRK